MVYIDNFYITGGGNFGRMKMSHMIADDTTELLILASAIGVDLKWIQYPGTPSEHFDVCISKRKLAVELGAKEISYRELGTMVVDRKYK